MMPEPTTEIFRNRGRRIPGLTALILGFAVVLPTVVAAQGGGDTTETIDFDRPESWAMKYFTSVMTPTQLGPPEVREPWSVDLDLELGWVPSLDEEQRRVGFNGTKVEDLNRSSLMARPRIRVGLPGGFGVDLSWVPPVELNGVTANVLTLGIDRAIVQGVRWSFGARIYGQVGESQGDYTCPEDVAAIPPGEEGNVWGCEAPSNDTVTMDAAGFAFTGGYQLGGKNNSAIHFGGGGSWMDLAFQTDAVTWGVHDQTRLETSGWTSYYNAGFSMDAWPRTRFAVEAFYSPLYVERRNQPRENDPLFNIRALLTYQLR